MKQTANPLHYPRLTMHNSRFTTRHSRLPSRALYWLTAAPIMVYAPSLASAFTRVRAIDPAPCELRAGSSRRHSSLHIAPTRRMSIDMPRTPHAPPDRHISQS